MLKSAKRWFTVSAKSSSTLPESLTSTGADSLRQAALAAWRCCSMLRLAAKSPSRRLPLSSTLAVTPTSGIRTSGKLHGYCLEIAMPTLVEELSARAKTLPAEDRARLAEELLESLDQEPESEVEAAWDREIERRVSEIESGTAELIPAEEVHAEARRLLRR